jgi:hypothetical protein
MMSSRTYPRLSLRIAIVFSSCVTPLTRATSAAARRMLLTLNRPPRAFHLWHMARAGQYNQSNAGRLLVLIVGLSRLRSRVKISDIRYFLGRHFCTAARIMRKYDGQNDDVGKENLIGIGIIMASMMRARSRIEFRQPFWRGETVTIRRWWAVRSAMSSSAWRSNVPFTSS